MALRTILSILGTGAITGTYLANGAVDATKLADDAVTSDKLADNAVGSAAIAANAITEAKIASGAVSAGKLADGASSLYYATVSVVTDIDVTLNGAPDAPYGVTLGVGSRVLCIGQTDTSENGIYAVTTVGTGSDGVWARPSSRDTAAEMPEGLLVYDRNTDKIYKLVTAAATLDTDPVIFEEQQEGLTSGNGGEPEVVGTGDGTNLNFDLGAASPAFVAVIVNGIVQAPGTYSVSATGGTGGVAQLQFGSGNAPASGAVVEAITLYRS